jgi:hypothetical protein
MSDYNLIKFDERVERGHLQFKCKCLGCGLHFSVCSWYKDWVKKVEKITCPECSQKKVMVLATRSSDKQIYEEVPGMGNISVGEEQPTGCCPLCGVEGCRHRYFWDLIESEDFECPYLDDEDE